MFKIALVAMVNKTKATDVAAFMVNSHRTLAFMLSTVRLVFVHSTLALFYLDLKKSVQSVKSL